MSPKEWYNMTIGKSYNTDGAYGFQCWDYFDFFKKYMGLTLLSTYCALTGYAGDIWKLRNTNGASNYFLFIKPESIREGDWVFYDKHVAFVYSKNSTLLEVGQNQIPPRYTVTAMTLNRKGILGAFRYKHWTNDYKKGVADYYNYKYAGVYAATAPLNVRAGGGTEYYSYGVIKKDTLVNCYGYYTKDTDGRIWLYIITNINGKDITGFICSDYVRYIRRL